MNRVPIFFRTLSLILLQDFVLIVVYAELFGSPGIVGSAVSCNDLIFI